MSEIVNYYSLLSTAINELQERNYSKKRFLESMNNLYLVSQQIREIGKQLDIPVMKQYDFYFKTFGEVCIDASYHLRDKGEGYILAFLSHSYFILDKVVGSIENPITKQKFQNAIGDSPVLHFSTSYSKLNNLSLTEKCLLASTTRVWLETLCTGILRIHPQYAALSRLAYKQIRTEADRGFVEVRFNDLEKTKEIIQKPLVCITQILSRIPLSARNHFLEFEFFIDEIKKQGVQFGYQQYRIGLDSYEVPKDFLPFLMDLQKSM